MYLPCKGVLSSTKKKTFEMFCQESETHNYRNALQKEAYIENNFGI
jgi:hypothetical protein